MSIFSKLLSRTAALTATICFAVGASHAADLPQELPPHPDIFNWSGFYLGGHAGYAVEGNARARFPVATANAGLDGFLGGGYGGYNYQRGPFVLGSEADISFGDLDGSAAPVSRFDMDVHGSVRFRAGYAYRNVLPYLTVGLGVKPTGQHSG